MKRSNDIFVIDENRNITLAQDNLSWAKCMISPHRVVKSDDFDGTVQIRTVFLGVDVSTTGENPKYFETSIFGVPDIWMDCVRRYANWKEAEEGHEAMVQRVISHLATVKAEKEMLLLKEQRKKTK